jgi:MFS family permease
MATRWRQSNRALGRVFTNPNLRRLQTAFAGAWVTDWAFMVALGILAFRLGGAVAVGVAGLAKMLPAAIVSPLSAFLGDRYRRNVVLLWVQVALAIALVGSWWAVAAQWPQAVLYALAGVTGICMTLFRGTVSALMPWLARSADELVASNVVAAMIEGVGTLVGPLVGGAVAASVSPQAVFLGAGVLAFLGLGVVTRISPEGQELRTAGRARTGVVEEIREGFRELRGNHDARLVVVSFYGQAFVRGALNVFIVVGALGQLHMGPSGVGLLTAAVGAGSLAGSAAGLSLVGRRLGAPFALGLLLWGLPIAVLGIWASPSLALATLAIVGVGNALLDVSGFTLLQRLVPDARLSRVMGIFMGGAMAAIGIGSIVTPGLISWLGLGGAMGAVGLALMAVSIGVLPRLRRIDEAAGKPPPESDLLRSVPMFAPLSVAATEYLASSMQQVLVPAATRVIEEGDDGDRFYLVAEGWFEVASSGHHVARLGPGSHFGEIALVRDVPRTASVTAATEGRVYTIDRAAFVAALMGHEASLSSAQESIERRLTELRGIAPE